MEKWWFREKANNSQAPYLIFVWHRGQGYLLVCLILRLKVQLWPVALAHLEFDQEAYLVKTINLPTCLQTDLTMTWRLVFNHSRFCRHVTNSHVTLTWLFWTCDSHCDNTASNKSVLDNRLWSSGNNQSWASHNFSVLSFSILKCSAGFMKLFQSCYLDTGCFLNHSESCLCTLEGNVISS